MFHKGMKFLGQWSDYHLFKKVLSSIEQICQLTTTSHVIVQEAIRRLFTVEARVQF
jgi:hypothetical protein